MVPAQLVYARAGLNRTMLLCYTEPYSLLQPNRRNAAEEPVDSYCKMMVGRLWTHPSS